MHSEKISSLNASSPINEVTGKKKRGGQALAVSPTNPLSDIVELTRQHQKEITLGEGASIVANGFKNKVKNTVKTIIKHPLKTAAIIGITSASLLALPLVGISVAAGSAAMALGFGAIAIGKTGLHFFKAMKNNNQGNYDAARDNLYSVGGDLMDVGLSAPFLPAAFRTVKGAIKYGPASGFNNELFKKVCSMEGFKNKIDILRNANKDIIEQTNYMQLLDDMKVPVELRSGFMQIRNLKGQEFMEKAYTNMVKQHNMEGVAPELRFADEVPGGAMGMFDPSTGRITFNPELIEFQEKSALLNALRHELKHYEQFSSMARAENIGIDGLIKNVIKAKLDRVKSSSGYFPEPKTPEEWASFEKSLIEEATNKFNKDFFRNTISQKGIIKAGTAEHAKAQNYLDEYLKYPDIPMFELRKYFENLLEVEARQSGERLGREFVKQVFAAEKAAETAEQNAFTPMIKNNIQQVSLQPDPNNPNPNS